MVAWLALIGSSHGLAEAEACTGGASCPDLVYQGLTYPYPREPGSYLFIDGGVYPYLQVTDRLLGDSTVRLPDGTEIGVADLLSDLGLKHIIDEDLVPAVGNGSNPAPSQLARKYAAQSISGGAVVPVMKGRLSGYDVVWTPVFVDYGSMPATITRSPGTEVDIWVTWLPEELVKQMSETEGVGEALYALAELDNVDYAFDGPDPKTLQAYISCFGALTVDGEILAVDAVPALQRRFRPVSSSQALVRILPSIDWSGSVLELLYANVSDPQARAARSDGLRTLATIADDPNVKGMDSCAGSLDRPEPPLGRLGSAVLDVEDLIGVSAAGRCDLDRVPFRSADQRARDRR